jgi:hypothetical protein
MEAKIIEVKTSLISKVGFRFDVYAWYIATQRLDCDLDSLDTLKSDSLLYALLYGAYQSWVKHSFIRKSKYTHDQIKKMVNKMPYETVLKLIEAATDDPDKEGKKKSPLKWANLVTLFCGQCGMSLEDFYSSTWQYLRCISTGFYNKDVDRWRHTREILAMIFNKNNKRPKKSSQLIKLPTDTNGTTAKKMTPEEYKAMNELIKNSEFKTL